MPENRLSRRRFLQNTLAAGAAGSAVSRMTAAGYARVIGANERIRLGLIGCGSRGRWIVKTMVRPEINNATLAAICEIWKQRRESITAEATEIFGVKPHVFTDYRKLLEQPDIDAVIIATPAHQHCGQTIDAVQAGKHVYVEKPIAPVIRDLPELNKCYDAVKASKMIVQHGSQGVSSTAAPAIRRFIAEARLGKLFRIESTESLYKPYWMHYKGPETEAETDWKAFLYNRPYRPFDPKQHARWMGYHDFSSGPIGGWMSHFINFVHFVTDCDLPVAATAFGGRYAPTNDPACDAPDQVDVILEYREGFHTRFTTHFGNDRDHETTIFMFEKGTLRTRFGHNPGNAVFSSEGAKGDVKPQKLLPEDPPHPAPLHVQNWLDCIRNGKQPNAHMDFGYKQGIAVLMGDMAYSTGRKVTFDKNKREIRA